MEADGGEWKRLRAPLVTAPDEAEGEAIIAAVTRPYHCIFPNAHEATATLPYTTSFPFHSQASNTPPLPLGLPSLLPSTGWATSTTTQR